MSWPQILLACLWAVLLYAGLSIAELFLLRFQIVRKVAIPLNLVLLLLACQTFLAPLIPPEQPWALSGLRFLFLALAAYVVIRLLDRLVFDILIPRRRRKPVPIVIRDMARWAVGGLAAFLIIRTVFPNLNLNFLAISSIVVGYILGNATQDTLGNLIAGLALNTERPFSIGDWVMIANHTGQIVEMTWRATCLHTKNNDFILIPNSAIAREPIVNYSRPSRVHAVTVVIGVSYEAPPNKVRRVILSTLQGVPDILREPIPSVWLTNYGDFSISYQVRFFIDSFEDLEHIESQFMDRIWYHFKREGIVIPFPIRDVRMSQVPPPAAPARVDTMPEKVQILQEIDLFDPLSPEDLATLAASLREEIYARGEVLARQGDAGDTSFIIRSGRVKVTAVRGDREFDLARLSEGDIFGEMSLLTGEKRNATVTAEADTHVFALSHTVLGDLLKSNASLSDELARKLEQRNVKYRQILESVDEETVALAPPTSRALLLSRIREFFGLGK